ncbi:MAG: diacylglycerol kinase [Methylobacterium mesophilicum]|nr:diacylglycerol kinase [Methylobacterium mesophilicum]
MQRLLNAFRHSARAFNMLVRGERAFQEELALLLLAVPAAFLLSTTWLGFAILLASILFLMLVEVLNTAIEATCNAVTRDFRPEIKLAKDCGSLAVLLAILLTAGIWIGALAQRLAA